MAAPGALHAYTSARVRACAGTATQRPAPASRAPRQSGSEAAGRAAVTRAEASCAPSEAGRKRAAAAPAARPEGRGAVRSEVAEPLRRRRRRPHESGDDAPSWSVARRQLCGEAGAGDGALLAGHGQSRGAGGREGRGLWAAAGRGAVPGRAVSRGSRWGRAGAPGAVPSGRLGVRWARESPAGGPSYPPFWGVWSSGTEELEDTCVQCLSTNAFPEGPRTITVIQCPRSLFLDVYRALKLKEAPETWETNPRSVLYYN